MTAAARLTIAGVAAAAAFLGAQTPPAAPQPPAQTFRTGTDVVVVDVSVRDRGHPVAGLRAADFVVTDNGVRQRVESVEATAVPIDLTLVVDLSGNSQIWVPRPSRAKGVDQLQREVRQVATLLRPDDRIRVLVIDRNVEQVVPMQSVATLPPIGPFAEGGVSAAFDTLAAALLQPVGLSRRHVVVARTKGTDHISSIDAGAVAAVAEQSDAVFHVVVMESAIDNDSVLNDFQCQMLGLCWPTARFWTPHEDTLTEGPRQLLTQQGLRLKAAAEATGGGLHQSVGLSEPTLTGTFKKAFEDFRSSYVLRYTPQGVPQRGWHSIEVKVSGPRSHTVRARRGYLVEDGPPVPSPPPRVPDVPLTLAQLTAAYEQREYRKLVTGLRTITDPGRLLRDFTDAGNPWPASPRREAAFALELAETAVFSSNVATRQAGHDVIERFSRLIRHPLEPDVFERYWHFAALTLMEGAIRPALTDHIVARALERFPDEPRFLLSRAIAADQRWATRGDGADGSFAIAPPADQLDAVRRRYMAATVHDETSAEAHIRLAWFLHRAGQHGEALAHLKEAGGKPTVEPALRYLRELFLGHVSWALNDQDAAVARYKAALEISPAAQSARVALMNALLMRGDRDGAEALAEQIQTETATDRDPWWSYWQGQYRIHPLVMARLREMAR